METRLLGATGLRVSAVGLGTMTWGSQNDEAEAHRQMDYALDQGINFFDTAELYPVPPVADTQGATERFIGSWFRARGTRDKVILATKAIGRGEIGWVRDGKARLDRRNLEAALDASLTRLSTDYVDLYQLHWPDRANNRFGALGYRHVDDPDETPIEETLDALASLVRAGKVRHVGVSNETPWGVMRFLAAADANGAPRIASIQNAYSLLNRTFEVGLAEIAVRERCGLIAYAPLGAGTLSGKYLDGALPPGSRRAIDHRRSRYDTPRAERAVRAYLAIARKFALDPCRMAIAFALSRNFVTSVLVGATSMEQLRADISARELKLDGAVLQAIEEAHLADPNPCP